MVEPVINTPIPISPHLEKYLHGITKRKHTLVLLIQFEVFAIRRSKITSPVAPAKLTVAARLRSLRSDDPSSKGHPRSIKQESET